MDSDSVNLSSRAYAKLLLHAAKYPHCAVNGVLLSPAKAGSKVKNVGSSNENSPDGNRPSSGGAQFFEDSVPLFHQIQGLTPMIEVALGQIELAAAERGLVIAGYYHANENFRENGVDVFSAKIAERIADNHPGSALVTVDNRKLGLCMDTPALIATQNVDGKWRPRTVALQEGTLDAASMLLQKKKQLDLVDFDNHLDDLTQDYMNEELNTDIEAYL